jgi:hypothetical protein
MSIAKKFNAQFTSVTSQAEQRHHKSHEIFTSQTPTRTNFRPFYKGRPSEAIRRSSNSTAVGPDCLTTLHLKHLGSRGLTYLTNLFNLSIGNADLPVVWKTAHIIPIPKPGKPLNQSSSFRPISLLSPAVKILERLLPLVTPYPKLTPSMAFPLSTPPPLPCSPL